MSNTSKTAISLYIHIPFCISRCTYCDFNTFAGVERYIPEYIKSLQREIEFFSQQFADKYFIHTIYFGGGTPSIIPADSIRSVLNSIKSKFDLSIHPETTIEMNPNGIKLHYLNDLFAAGINRISIGMQSSDERELAILGRRHRFEDVKQCAKFALDAGFENISLDLMFGFPTQTLASLETTIKLAVSLAPQHLSVYGLTLHDRTPMERQISRGQLPVVDEDLAGDMYAWLMEKLQVFGLTQYEISNWSINEQFESRHNLQYWLNLNYLGIGAGAHSYVNHMRWNNANLISDYISGIQTTEENKNPFHNAVMDIQQLGRSDEIKETMMMGLRLTKNGVNAADFHARFNVRLEDLYAAQIVKFSSLGLVEYAGEGAKKCLRLTKQGRMLGNQVFMAFI